MNSIFIRTILIYVCLTITLKIMGKRQIGELEVNELVSTLLISEIAAIPIGDSDIPLLYAIIPILFISSLEIFISALKNRWHSLKHIVEGEPVYIIYKGRLKQSVLRENRISINEILTEMRIQGIGNLDDVYYGTLEQNGKISLFTKEEKDRVSHPIILDTVVDTEYLKKLGYDKRWLDNALSARHLRADEVFLMTVTDGGDIYIIKKEE